MAISNFITFLHHHSTLRPEEEFEFSRTADKSDDVFYCEKSDCNFIKNFNHDVDDGIWRVIVISKLSSVLGTLEF